MPYHFMRIFDSTMQIGTVRCDEHVMMKGSALRCTCQNPSDMHTKESAQIGLEKSNKHQRTGRPVGLRALGPHGQQQRGGAALL